MSSIASSLRQLSQASRKRLPAGTCPVTAVSTSRARLGAVPMPPMGTEARVILPAASPSMRQAARVAGRVPQPPGGARSTCDLAGRIALDEDGCRRDGEVAVPAREFDEGIA